MYSFFIGCDVSKATVDIAFGQEGTFIYLDSYSNDSKGFNKLVRDLKSFTDSEYSDWFFCFENTGVYSKALLLWLSEKGIPCREESALQISKSLGIKRGKDDKVDSKAICKYAYEKRGLINVTVPSKSLIVKLKTLLSDRERLIKNRTGCLAAIKTSDPRLGKEFKTKRQQSINELIKVLTDQIGEIEKSINELLKESPSVGQNAKLVASVIGVGLITTANFIVLTNNFQDFTDSRKFACYTGVAPFPNSSGIRKGAKRVNKMANRKMKSLLSNGALSAVVNDPELKIYYQRKLSEGKPKGVVLNAVKNKLIQRVFSVVKRQKPYVKIYKYAS